jgi:hypothetical protein
MSGGDARFGWITPVANGNVTPFRVVVGVNGAGNEKKVVQASTAGTLPALGVAQPFTRFPPGSPADDGYIAVSGESVPILTPGQIGRARAGAAISDCRYPLTYDNQGRVVTAAPSGGTVWCIGYPLMTVGAADEVVELVVVPTFPWYAP